MILHMLMRKLKRLEDLLFILFESNANESDYMSLSDLSKIITYVQNIDKAYFSEFGFKDPAYESGETKCHIYFASELDSATFPVKMLLLLRERVHTLQ